MKPFFASDHRQAGLQHVAQSWAGTPFVPHACIKRAGVDCVHLAAEIYRESCVFDRYEFGSYTMDGGHHNAGSQVLAWVENSAHFIRGVYPPLPGDLVCFTIGKSVHHVGVMVSDKSFIHVRQRYTASFSRIDEPTWIKRLAGVYRPVEL